MSIHDSVNVTHVNASYYRKIEIQGQFIFTIFWLDHFFLPKIAFLISENARTLKKSTLSDRSEIFFGGILGHKRPYG